MGRVYLDEDYLIHQKKNYSSDFLACYCHIKSSNQFFLHMFHYGRRRWLFVWMDSFRKQLLSANQRWLTVNSCEWAGLTNSRWQLWSDIRFWLSNDIWPFLFQQMFFVEWKLIVNNLMKIKTVNQERDSFPSPFAEGVINKELEWLHLKWRATNSYDACFVRKKTVHLADRWWWAL